MIKMSCVVNKILPLTIGGLFYIVSPALYAEEVRLHYTCFVELDNQEQVISQFVTSEKSRRKFLSSIIGKKVFSPDGVSHSIVTNVIECITKNESFKNDTAQGVDRTTPR